MNQQKQLVAAQAIEYISRKYTNDLVLGIGSGSTVQFFIEQIKLIQHKCKSFVASSLHTEYCLQQQGIVVDNSQLMNIDVYIDSADQVNKNLYMLKGGGSALTREKILAVNAREFICIVDNSKIVDNFSYPVVVESINIARPYVAKKLISLGGQPVWREDCITDNGNSIIDVYHLSMANLMQLEQEINNITGVVENGIFAHCPANILLHL